MDMHVNPHMDNALRQYWRMAVLRKILAKKVAERMATGPLDTQKKLAAKAKIAQSHVSRIVNAAAGATVDAVEKVASALGCEPYELFIDDEIARRALIERLVTGPHVSTERVESVGYVKLQNTESAPPKRQPRKDPARPARGNP